MGGAENPGPELVAKLVQGVLKQFDARAGGLIAAEVSALGRDRSAAGLGFAGIDRRGDGGGERYGEAGRAGDADKMQKGGSTTTCGGLPPLQRGRQWWCRTSRRWHTTTASCLKNYVHAYQTFVEPENARVAREIISGWIWLSDREQGGFYASAGRDFSLDDDGRLLYVDHGMSGRV